MEASGVDFSGAIMSNSDLRFGEFRKCHFENTKFTKANLSGADFSFSNFQNANLEGALIVDANVRRCKFLGTDFTGVRIFGNKFITTLQSLLTPAQFQQTIKVPNNDPAAKTLINF